MVYIRFTISFTSLINFLTAYPDYYSEVSLPHTSQFVDSFPSEVKKYKHDFLKILVVGANKTEDIELATLLTVLRKGSLYTQFAGLFISEEDRAENIITAYNIIITPDADPDHIIGEKPYDMIILPGGLGYRQFMHHKTLVKVVKEQDKAFRYIAAMSEAVFFLHFHEIGFGKQITLPVCLKKWLSSDYYTNNIGIVQDGHLLTCQGPLSAMEFAIHVVEMFRGREKAEKLARRLGYSRNLTDIKIVKPHYN
ncbi:Parkinson disease protein 7 homolog [Lycorma delicatula]|uniref:Parkinson disease protein 7 homolog n=1 Tax=Lycorma delicatula TaxID=130591 RepID=UPI003F510C7B